MVILDLLFLGRNQKEVGEGRQGTITVIYPQFHKTLHVTTGIGFHFVVIIPALLEENLSALP